MKFKKRIAAITMMLAMLVSCIFGVSAFAATSYEPLSGSSNACTVKKYLIIDSTNVPAATFNFSISGPTVESTDGSATGTGAITSTATFPSNAQNTPYTTVQTGDNLSLSSGEKYDKQNLTVDLSGVTFTEPGIYRFTITESGSNPGITNDSTSTLYLDVYVTDAGTVNQTSGKPELTASYVLHSDSAVHTADSSISAEYKPDGFKNRYSSKELTISKTVTGNQGSRDKYFKFDVSISGLAAGAKYAIDLTNADSAVPDPASAATASAYAGEVNYGDGTAADPYIEGASSGATTATFYLQHGQSITINGLPDGATYTVTETKEDYTATASITGDPDAAFTANNAQCADSTTGITADTTLAFTNNRAGIIPTGIIVTFLPYAIAFLVVAGGLVTVLAAKKRNAMR